MESIRPYDAEFLQSKYENIKKLFSMISKSKECLSLLDHFKERYILTPASHQKNYHFSFPGGLMCHSLNVLRWMTQLETTICPSEYNKESLIIVSLLHDFGKVGDENKNYYIPTESEWHRNKGIYYEINNDISYMKINHRSLYLCQKFNIGLSQSEYLAIMLNEGMNDENNIFYKYKEPSLAFLLYVAKQMSIKQEKNTKILWPKLTKE